MTTEFWTIEFAKDGASEKKVTFRATRRRSITIGRALGCGLRIDEAGISNLHACIELGRAPAVVRDIPASGGTWVNGQRVEHATIGEKDIVRLGSTCLRIRREAYPLSSIRVPMKDCPCSALHESLGASGVAAPPPPLGRFDNLLESLNTPPPRAIVAPETRLENSTLGAWARPRLTTRWLVKEMKHVETRNRILLACALLALIGMVLAPLWILTARAHFLHEGQSLSAVLNSGMDRLPSEPAVK